MPTTNKILGQIKFDNYILSGGTEYSAVIKPDSTLWAWGSNSYYQLGMGTSTGAHISSPVQVGNLTTWAQIYCASRSSLAIKTDGTLWAWGRNAVGQLGLGDRLDRSVPVQVSGGSWAQLSGGMESVAMITTSGRLFTCGHNLVGELGNNSTVDRSLLVQVGNLSTWAQVYLMGDHVLAIQTDGTLWAWGHNDYGELGLGYSSNVVEAYSSPVQVGNDTDWAQVFGNILCSLAIKTDGTLWAWGQNYYGDLGLGDWVDRSSPVQVGNLDTWLVGCSGHGAIQTDGTLWAWGHNDYGQLGLGDTVNRNSPVQVGNLTTWAQCCLREPGGFVIARMSDNTFWAWGRNTSELPAVGGGQLGLGDRIARSSPVQVGSFIDWMNLQLYCVPNNTQAIVNIFAANQGPADVIRIAVIPSGEVFSDKHYLVYDEQLTYCGIYDIKGINLNAGDKIQVFSFNKTTSFTATGVEIT